MQAFFIAMVLVMGQPWEDEDRSPPEKNGVPLPQIELCFFPPDIVPHPDIPGTGPKVPEEVPEHGNC